MSEYARSSDALVSYADMSMVVTLFEPLRVRTLVFAPPVDMPDKLTDPLTPSDPATWRVLLGAVVPIPMFVPVS